MASASPSAPSASICSGVGCIVPHWLVSHGPSAAYEAERPNEVLDRRRAGRSVRAVTRASAAASAPTSSSWSTITRDCCVHGRWVTDQNTRAGQDVLRAAIQRRGLPERLYVDNGAPVSQRRARTQLRGARHPPDPQPTVSTPGPRQTGAAQSLHPRAVPARGRGPGHRQLQRAQRSLHGLGRASVQHARARRDRPDAHRTLHQPGSTAGRRAIAAARGLPLVGHAPRHHHRLGLAGWQSLRRRSRR